MKNLEILVSYPSDQGEQVKHVRAALDEVADSYFHQNVNFKILDWKDNITTGTGNRAQEVINKQVSNIDGIVAIIGHRLGLETGGFLSGVDEEISKAREKFGISSGRVHVLFNDKAPALSDLDPVEIQKIQDFKIKLSDDGILYSEFKTSRRLKKLCRQAASKIHMETVPQNLTEEPRNPKFDSIEEVRAQLAKMRELPPVGDSLIMEAILSIVEHFFEVFFSISEKNLEKILSADEQDLVAKIMVADQSMSNAVVDLKRHLDYIFNRILSQASVFVQNEEPFAKFAQFGLFGLIEMFRGASLLIAGTIREKAEQLEALEISDREGNFAKGRLVESVSELADIVEGSSDNVMLALTSSGWKVQLPTQDIEGKLKE